MSFEKPMSLALGPLPLWFLALWANFGCVVLTSFTVKSTDECQECPKVRIWPLPAFFRQSIFSCSELTWSNTQQNALPETNISPLKIGLPKRQLVFQPSIFRCKVSFSEAKKKTPSACWSTWPSRVSLRPFVFFFSEVSCALLGAIFGPLAYLSGEHFGALKVHGRWAVWIWQTGDWWLVFDRDPYNGLYWGSVKSLPQTLKFHCSTGDWIRFFWWPWELENKWYMYQIGLKYMGLSAI